MKNLIIPETICYSMYYIQFVVLQRLFVLYDRLHGNIEEGKRLFGSDIVWTVQVSLVPLFTAEMRSIYS